MVDRDAVTTWLLTVLAGMNVPVGDHEAPASGGWESGTPGQGEFTPYAVLSSGQATVRESGLCPGAWDWTALYQVKCFSVSRRAADQLADWVCGEMPGLPRQQFGLYYRTNMTRVTALSPVVGDSATNPKTWSTTVSLQLDLVATQKR